MNAEIKYDYIRIDADIKNIKQLKSKLPIAKGKLTSYEWDYLYTGYSKGDTIDALIDLYTQTCNRMIAIDQLLDNILILLKQAKSMEKIENELVKGFTNK